MPSLEEKKGLGEEKIWFWLIMINLGINSLLKRRSTRGWSNVHWITEATTLRTTPFPRIPTRDIINRSLAAPRDYLQLPCDYASNIWFIFIRWLLKFSNISCICPDNLRFQNSFSQSGIIAPTIHSLRDHRSVMKTLVLFQLVMMFVTFHGGLFFNYLLQRLKGLDHKWNCLSINSGNFWNPFSSKPRFINQKYSCEDTPRVFRVSRNDHTCWLSIYTLLQPIW